MSKGNRLPPIPPKVAAIGLEDKGDKGRITVTKSADGEGKFIRNSGARGQYRHVTIHIEPNDRGEGVSILREIKEGAIPDEFLDAVAIGIRSALDLGIDDRPIVDVVIRISGGSWNAMDSSDLAYKRASIFAVKDALKKAEPIVVD